MSIYKQKVKFLLGVDSIDHEFVPVTTKEPTTTPQILKVNEFSEKENKPATSVSQEHYKRRYIKIPNEDAVIIPLHGDSDEEINPDRYVNKELTVQEIPDKLEAQYITLASHKINTEVKIERNGEMQSTAQVAEPAAGEQQTVQQVKEQFHGFQNLLKYQAGRFRNKLKNLSAPKIFPQRPKFKLPEAPTIKLPDRPKFLRERPKFHLSKLYLPEQLISEKPNPSSTRSPHRDETTVSSQTELTNNDKRNMFKLKTFPRFLNQEKERYQLTNLETRIDTERSRPSTPTESRKKNNPSWLEIYRDIKFADDDNDDLPTTVKSMESLPVEIQDEEGYEDSTSSFYDCYMHGIIQLQEGPMKAKLESERGSVYDTDEYFLGEKGQIRDVDVSHCLKQEIRISEIPEVIMETNLTDNVGTKESNFNMFPRRPYRRKQVDPLTITNSLSRSITEGLLDTNFEPPPLPPKTKQSNKSLNRSEHDNAAADIDIADMMHRQFDRERYGTTLVPLRKSHSRRLSLSERNTTQREADSIDLPLDDIEFLKEKMEIQQHKLLTQSKPAYIKESPVTGGYAAIMKPCKRKPPPPRPPPPPSPVRQRKMYRFQSHLHNIRDQGMSLFFSYPRQAIKSLHKLPIRPIRNYCTIGSSTPSRISSRLFREPVDIEVTDNKDEQEVKNLQSGEVVERMKGRPLPPPPRPPRKGKNNEREVKDKLIQDVVEEISENTVGVVKQAELGLIESKRNEILSSLPKINPFNAERRKKTVQSNGNKNTSRLTIETSQQTSFEFSEVSVAVQTDPLPEGYYIVESELSEIDDETASQRDKNEIDDYTRLEHSQTHLLEIREFDSNSFPNLEKCFESGSPLPSSFRPLQVSCRDDYEQNFVKPGEKTPSSLTERNFTSIYPESIPVFPVKLSMSELDVKKLCMNELYTSKIATQKIDDESLNVSQLTTRRGNPTVNSIELPPNFIQNLAAQLQTRLPRPQPQHPQSLAAEKLTKEATPPPSIVHQSPTRVIIDDLEDEIPASSSSQPARDYWHEKIVESSSSNGTHVIDERNQMLPALPDESSSSTSYEITISPTAMQLIGQLLVIWHKTFIHRVNTFMDGVTSLFPVGEKRRDAQTTACILIVLIAGLILIGFGIDNTVVVHHHHWDYVPPLKKKK